MMQAAKKKHVAFLGHARVGKTACLVRMKSNCFDKEYEPSVSVEFHLFKTMNFCVWDFAGSTQFAMDVKSASKATGEEIQPDIVVIFIDPTNKASLDIARFVKMTPSNANTIIVVTKNDLEEEWTSGFQEKLKSVVEHHQLQDAPTVYCSASDPRGTDPLQERIHKIIAAEASPANAQGGSLRAASGPAVAETVERYELIRKAVSDYINWHMQSRTANNRGRKGGLLSWMRHGSAGLIRANKLNEKHDSEFIDAIVTYINSSDLRLHKHSLGSYLGDASDGGQKGTYTKDEMLRFAEQLQSSEFGGVDRLNRGLVRGSCV